MRDTVQQEEGRVFDRNNQSEDLFEEIQFTKFDDRFLVFSFVGDPARGFDCVVAADLLRAISGCDTSSLFLSLPTPSLWLTRPIRYVSPSGSGVPSREGASPVSGRSAASTALVFMAMATIRRRRRRRRRQPGSVTGGSRSCSTLCFGVLVPKGRQYARDDRDGRTTVAVVVAAASSEACAVDETRPTNPSGNGTFFSKRG